jgi:hypothetical protein
LRRFGLTSVPRSTDDLVPLRAIFVFLRCL